MYAMVVGAQDSMKPALWIDGQAVTLAKAYSSRGRQVPRCFLGFFYDATSLTTGATHQFSLWLPNLQLGQFRGLFWENIVPDARDAEHVVWCRTPSSNNQLIE